MKAYFNRREPFYLTDEANFDGVEVDIDAVAIANIRSLRKLLVDMEALIESNGAPEETAQQEADFFVAQIRKIFKTRKQDNVNK